MQLKQMTAQIEAAQPTSGAGSASTGAVSDADLAMLAQTILTNKGVPADPANVQQFVQRNRAALTQQIVKARQGEVSNRTSVLQQLQIETHPASRRHCGPWRRYGSRTRQRSDTPRRPGM